MVSATSPQHIDRAARAPIVVDKVGRGRDLTPIHHANDKADGSLERNSVHCSPGSITAPARA
jgi:hypothetical protein